MWISGVPSNKNQYMRENIMGIPHGLEKIYLGINAPDPNPVTYSCAIITHKGFAIVGDTLRVGVRLHVINRGIRLSTSLR